MRVFVVTGATGNVGSEVVDQLVRRGLQVRALVRDPAASIAAGATPIAGDLTVPESLRAAFVDAEAVFLLPGYPGVAAAARDAGVRRIVLLSGGSAGSADLSNAITRYMRQSETEVRDTALEWTFLRPTAFMSNALRWKPQLRAGDTVRLPFADVPIACVHPADIAAVATTALVEAGHHAMIYRPTGPAALLPEEQVDILAQALDRPLRFEAQSNAEARRALLESTPPEYVAAFFDFYVNGALDETTVRPTVGDVTGQAPQTFQSWSHANADQFTRSPP